MNDEEIIAAYESVAQITGQMLNAARTGAWDDLISLENRCARHVKALENNEIPSRLTRDFRNRKIAVIKKILADDKEIRGITEPWMQRLSSLMQSNATERKLSVAYGSAQAG
ncbi:MAG TPA: flagellar protein FliT [Burkholderiales bacterium]|nr:flagellar protein FliT [Burkholderiales bacterium]